jgi:hypothetical protein
MAMTAPSTYQHDIHSFSPNLPHNNSMSKERDSKKRIAFPIQLFQEGSAFAELPDEIHVVPTGEWKHPVYGEMKITSADIQEFVRNFKDKVRRDIPITAGHDNGMNGGELPAVGSRS